MLNHVIRFALHQRVLVLASSVALVVLGGWQATRLDIDVFPDLDRPRVVILTEAPGMAPEEVEALVTLPLETAVNGAHGVLTVRSASGIGISTVAVEFDWGTDVADARQIVSERLRQVGDRLPEGLDPQLTPVSSIMGQVLSIGMWSRNGTTDTMQLRTIADWVVGQRLRSIGGVSQVLVLGGERRQFQVLLDPLALRRFNLAVSDIRAALAAANQNTAGGFLVGQGPHELIVRGMGRVGKLEDLEKLVIRPGGPRPVLLSQVAQIREGAAVKRGDSAAWVRGADGKFVGGPCVMLIVTRQPGADTVSVCNEVDRALEDLADSLPPDIQIESALYSQADFINRSVTNVAESLRDGAVLVTIVLLLFLLSARTAVITLVTIPLSLLITALVFAATDLSINTMTLGGLAIAIGELVDDAIVGVENVLRRLRENHAAGSPRGTFDVVYTASLEVRGPIVFGTLIVILVFLPVMALVGIEGRLFRPLAIAYIVSILASLVISVTLTPVLCYWLLGGADRLQRRGAGWLLEALQWIGGRAIRLSLRAPRLVLLVAVAAVALATVTLANAQRDFLPPFNEGFIQLNVMLQPGTSLEQSTLIATIVDERLKTLPDVMTFIRRTGRAEQDEHVDPVSHSDIVIRLASDSDRTREEQKEMIRETLQGIPGIATSVEQPLAHLMRMMVSGVRAEVGIKIYGDRLDRLRGLAEEVRSAIEEIDGVTDLFVEPQVVVPQLRVEVNRDELARYGLQPADVTQVVALGLNGEVVSQVLDGQRTFDLLVRLEEASRENLDRVRRLPLRTPDGRIVPVEAVARIYRSGGPNTIRREQVRRRVVVQCDVSGRGLVEVAEEIRRRVSPIEQSLPSGYFIEYSGHFERANAARRTLGIVFGIILAAMLVVLYVAFQSWRMALQVLAAIPMALIGAVAALELTGQTVTVAAMIGFISLTGIACRNGILLLNHYRTLAAETGSGWTVPLLVRAGRERLAPVLMTALTSGIGLAPLAMVAGEPGKEVLYPVATVIIGGLCSSTLLEFLVRPALFWIVGAPLPESAQASSSA